MEHNGALATLGSWNWLQLIADSHEIKQLTSYEMTAFTLISEIQLFKIVSPEFFLEHNFFSFYINLI